MFQFSRSEFFNFELIRILTTAPYDGCDVAEFLEAVGQIKDSPDRWHQAWQKQGEKAEAIAKEAGKKGDIIAARRAHFRACNYFRASQCMMFDKPQSPDPRVMPIFRRSMTNFEEAIKFLDGPVKRLEIPYGKHKLPGYLYLPPSSKRLPGKIPLVVNTNGADSTQEENYFMLPAEGPHLSYAVLTFEGPGQGIVLRKDNLHHRPDWEVVTTAVIDHLFHYSSTHLDLELDLDRLSIAGASMGGYYAIRGASDPRIKA
jgi:Esterase FrsA-like